MTAYEEIMKQISRRASLNGFGIEVEDDYYEDVDGYSILYCGTCKQPKQTIMFTSDITYQEQQEAIESYALKHTNLSRAECEKIVLSQRPPKHRRKDFGLAPCMCRCQQEYRQGITRSEYSELKKAEIRKNKCNCFPAPAMWNDTFEKYESNQHIKACKRYAQKFGEMRKGGKGLILCGRSGSGKTIAAVCLANELLNRGYSIGFKVQQEITYAQDRSAMLNEVLGYTLLIIDDFNIQNDYGRDILFYVIDMRIKAKKPTVITSNVSAEGLRNPKQENKRLYSRLTDSDSFYIIENSDKDYRKRTA